MSPLVSSQRVHAGCLPPLFRGHTARCQESWSRGGEASGAPSAEWPAVPGAAGMGGMESPMAFSALILTTSHKPLSQPQLDQCPGCCFTLPEAYLPPTAPPPDF